MTDVRAKILDGDGNANSATYPLYTQIGNTTVPVVGVPAVATVTIAIGTATSAYIDLGGTSLTGIYTPSALTNSTLCVLSAPTSGGTYAPCYNDTNTAVAISVATNAARFVGLDTFALAVAPARYIKIQAGTATTSATEAATRTFYLATK